MWEDLPLFPQSASTVSDSVDALYGYLVLVASFFTLLILVLVVGFAIRYRRRAGGPKVEQIEGSLRLELVWTLVPLAIALSFFVWGSTLYVRLQRMPVDATDVYVVGRQWMWKMQHATGQREINDLHVPVGRKMRLTLASEDVIHSFFVPAFRVKRDVVPGVYTHAWFEATKPGEYHLFCAEYCGTQHSRMIGTVYVMEVDDYERWLEGAASGEPPEVAGRLLFESMRCDTCHEATSTSAARGPDLHGLLGRRVPLRDGSEVVADEAYVRESILRPMAKVVAGFEPVMPTYEGQLGEEQILQIVAYLKTLRGGEQGGAR